MLCERHKVKTSFQMLRWMPGVGIVKFLHVSSAIKLTDFLPRHISLKNTMLWSYGGNIVYNLISLRVPGNDYGWPGYDLNPVCHKSACPNRPGPRMLVAKLGPRC